jgi:lysozyme family protein
MVAAMIPNTFENCYKLVLQFDGFRNDRAPGEAFVTSYGITEMTRAWAVQQGVVDDKPLAQGTVAAFETIRRAMYWNPLHASALPAGAGLMVYNDGVLCGTRHETRLLQRVLGVAQDGCIGPMTIKAAGGFGDKRLIDALAKADETYLAALRRALFLKGWTRREEEARALAHPMAGVPAGAA